MMRRCKDCGEEIDVIDAVLDDDVHQFRDDTLMGFGKGFYDEYLHTWCKEKRKKVKQ
jgi:hypothetical protein